MASFHPVKLPFEFDSLEEELENIIQEEEAKRSSTAAQSNAIKTKKANSNAQARAKKKRQKEKRRLREEEITTQSKEVKAGHEQIAAGAPFNTFDGDIKIEARGPMAAEFNNLGVSENWIGRLAVKTVVFIAGDEDGNYNPQEAGLYKVGVLRRRKLINPIRAIVIRRIYPGFLQEEDDKKGLTVEIVQLGPWSRNLEEALHLLDNDLNWKLWLGKKHLKDIAPYECIRPLKRKMDQVFVIKTFRIEPYDHVRDRDEFWMSHLSIYGHNLKGRHAVLLTELGKNREATMFEYTEWCVIQVKIPAGTADHGTWEREEICQCAICKSQEAGDFKKYLRDQIPQAGSKAVSHVAGQICCNHK